MDIASFLVIIQTENFFILVSIQSNKNDQSKIYKTRRAYINILCKRNHSTKIYKELVASFYRIKGGQQKDKGLLIII